MGIGFHGDRARSQIGSVLDRGEKGRWERKMDTGKRSDEKEEGAECLGAEGSSLSWQMTDGGQNMLVNSWTHREERNRKSVDFCEECG